MHPPIQTASKTGPTALEPARATSDTFPVELNREVPQILPPRGRYTRWGWRFFNAALLIGSLPVAILIALPVALFIKLESWGTNQSIFFRQRRVGLDGKPFELIKFRSMNAATYQAGSEFDSWSTGDAGRTTRIGAFLRKSHIDEIPQLLNVLKGEMAIIGPRPDMVEISDWAESQLPLFSARLGVLPGITGWAQVKQGYCGQNVDHYQRKLDLDLEYIRKRTIKMDVRITAMTAHTMIGMKGWRLGKQTVTE